MTSLVLSLQASRNHMQVFVWIKMVYCSAFNCNNDGKKMKQLSFFQFPSDEKYRQIWKEKVRRLNWEPNKNSRLCSAHFEPHCYATHPKVFESLGIPKPKKVLLKHDAIPTIFDYEDRSTKPKSNTCERKHEESKKASFKGRKMLEVIDFTSLLDDYLKGLQSEEDLSSPGAKKGSDELVTEIVPSSSPCEGGDKFVLLLNKPLPEEIDEIERSLLCVRFGIAHVVPVTMWDDQVIRGEQIPRSETPGLVTVQLETNDGRVLGSTQFTYKEEICSGFQKIVCSANYRGKFMKAFSSNGPSKDSVTTDRNETETDVALMTPSESSLALTSILKLMLYIAAKSQVSDFVKDLFKTETGNALIKCFKENNHLQEPETDLKPILKQRLTTYLDQISSRLTTEEQEQKARDLQHVKSEGESKPKPVKIPELKKRPNLKEIKTKQFSKLTKAKRASTKKPINASSILSECVDMSSKTNSLLLLSDVALSRLRDYESDNSATLSLSRTPSNSTVIPKKEQKPRQVRNGFKFTRRVVLLPRGCTRLPPVGELLKIKSTTAVNSGTVDLEKDMTADAVLKQVRTVLSTLGKKRIRLAAADARGQLEVFKATKWTGRNIRQRIKSNSVLYVVPS